jgi:integrase
MPKKAKELSAFAVAKLKKEGFHAVGGTDGLHLKIRGGSRSWVFRTMTGTRTDSQGKIVVWRRDFGLGSFPEVTLAEARERAREIRLQIRTGLDPFVERKLQRDAAEAMQAKLKAFRQCAEIVLINKSREGISEKQIKQWETSLSTYVYPFIGDRIIGSLSKANIVSVLEPIWVAKHETAYRVRRRVEAVFDYAKAMELCEGDNPAAWKGMLEPILGKVKRNRLSQPSLPYSEMGRFMSLLRGENSTAARALEFIILCATRSNEVFGAKWDEINWEERVWTIPAERMKARKPHRVPLSDQAFSLLQSLPQVGGTPYIFPSKSKGKFYTNSLPSFINGLHQVELNAGRDGFFDPKQGRVVTTHGFRSTFRDWSAEQTDYPRDVCEHALAHKLPDATEAAYLRGDFLAKRTQLMQDWADYCNQITQDSA